jgi:predicted dehydrogenase
MIERQEIGRIHKVRVQWSRPSTSDAPVPQSTRKSVGGLRSGEQWRAGGSAGRWWSLAALGTHCIDTALWLLEPRARVHRLSALTSSTRFDTDRDETAQVSMLMSDKTLVEVTSSVTLARTKRIEIFHGDGGLVVCEDTFGPNGDGTITVDGAALDFVAANPYVGELSDFADAIRQDRDPEVSGFVGLNNVAILCAAEEDAKEQS